MIYLLAFLVFLIAIVAMALGVMLQGKAIRGSCGGLSQIHGLEDSCLSCAKKEGTCKKSGR